MTKQLIYPKQYKKEEKYKRIQERNDKQLESNIFKFKYKTIMLNINDIKSPNKI